VSGSRAVLARTNAELVPFAAVALELGIRYQVEDDGLLLGDPALLAALDRAIAHAGPSGTPLPTLARVIHETGLTAEAGAALLSWAAPYGRLIDLHDALRARVSARGAHAASATGGGPSEVLTLATFHATKGLEWDHVACIGHDEGTFPAERALREAPDPGRVLEEERRLAYVAWTRARRSLTLVYDPGAPSPFLREAFDARELTREAR
jgi:superfamily I DNA/RNA helicase